MYNAETIKNELNKIADKEKAIHLSRFFKTGKGEYGEGDVFIGIQVPHQRKIAKQFPVADLSEIEKLIDDPVHEFRLTALLLLIELYKKAGEEEQKNIVNFYLKKSSRINNWDLVDLSAPQIIGHFYYSRKRDKLYQLVKSSSLWEQRIAVVSTYYFIKKSDFNEILAFSEMLLEHKHDLIHKASGWMLREAGKMDLNVLRGFLDKHHKVMPRTMLRYSIEKLDKSERLKYMLK
ncbi:MAG: DNA alkylation repair protein [Spirochaetae bacterium HGW-Spirochaetae-5]|nr:MAG: DNA alkylation repair protein [Spirochaetae bacterium HGW-Spirochaetae-5]